VARQVGRTLKTWKAGVDGSLWFCCMVVVDHQQRCLRRRRRDIQQFQETTYERRFRTTIKPQVQECTTLEQRINQAVAVAACGSAAAAGRPNSEPSVDGAPTCIGCELRRMPDLHSRLPDDLQPAIDRQHAPARTAALQHQCRCAPAGYPAGWKAGLLVRPSASNMARSSDRSLLGVVSSLSPSKMLLAPARKHSACRQHGAG
jgi:hypothetical protein